MGRLFQRAPVSISVQNSITNAKEAASGAERLLHTQEVAGSSPAAPTNLFNNIRLRNRRRILVCDAICDVTLFVGERSPKGFGTWHEPTVELIENIPLSIHSDVGVVVEHPL